MQEIPTAAVNGGTYVLDCQGNVLDFRMQLLIGSETNEWYNCALLFSFSFDPGPPQDQVSMVQFENSHIIIPCEVRNNSLRGTLRCDHRAPCDVLSAACSRKHSCMLPPPCTCQGSFLLYHQGLYVSIETCGVVPDGDAAIPA